MVPPPDLHLQQQPKLGRRAWLSNRPEDAVMTTIPQEDLIQSIADALQYISYFHPEDYITNLARAYDLGR